MKPNANPKWGDKGLGLTTNDRLRRIYERQKAITPCFTHRAMAEILGVTHDTVKHWFREASPDHAGEPVTRLAEVLFPRPRLRQFYSAQLALKLHAKFWKLSDYAMQHQKGTVMEFWKPVVIVKGDDDE